MIDLADYFKKGKWLRPLRPWPQCPDLSLYEVKVTGGGQGDNKVNDDDNSIPTVVCKYACSEVSTKVARNSARHLSLSRGRVQLVVALRWSVRKLERMNMGADEGDVVNEMWVRSVPVLDWRAGMSFVCSPLQTHSRQRLIWERPNIICAR